MNSLQNYIQKRQETIESILKKPEDSYTPTTFHRLRVEMKKWFACAGLVLSGLSANDRKKVVRPLRELFRLAGKVREIQVTDMKIKKYPSGNLFLPRTDKARERFFVALRKPRMRRLREMFAAIRLLSALSTERTQMIWLEQQQRRIQTLMEAGRSDPSKWHELRTRLKRYDYVRKSLGRDAFLPEQEMLTARIGDWHDYNTIAVRLEKALMKHRKDPEALLRLTRLRFRIARLHDAKRHAILRILNRNDST